MENGRGRLHDWNFLSYANCAFAVSQLCGQTISPRPSGACTFRMRRRFVEQHASTATTIRIPELDEPDWDIGVPGQSSAWGAQSCNTIPLWVPKHRVSSNHAFKSCGQAPVAAQLD